MSLYFYLYTHMATCCACFDSLLSSLSLQTLEDVFLKLCKRQEEDKALGYEHEAVTIVSGFMYTVCRSGECVQCCYDKVHNSY